MSQQSGKLPAAEAINLAGLVDYAPGSIVSRALIQAKSGSLTVFAFDAGQGLSEHTSPYDAHVLVLDGTALLHIGGKPVAAKAGDIVLMPANVPHGLEAQERFKMLLTMVKG